MAIICTEATCSEIFLVLVKEYFHSCDQRPYLFIKTETKGVCIKQEVNSHRVDLVQQWMDGRRFVQELFKRYIVDRDRKLTIPFKWMVVGTASDSVEQVCCSTSA